MALVLANRPAQVTLVPDPPGVLTSNAGWDAIGHKDLLTKVIATFKDAGIRTSIFIETDHEQIAAAKATGTDRIELYTEAYATGYLHDRDAAVAPFVSSAAFAKSIGLGVNAGHDLSLENLSFFAQKLHGNLDEVSIGHALISDALYLGLHNTIQQYRNCLNPIAWK
jgi:pyridoxine 5-phosphate synthase